MDEDDARRQVRRREVLRAGAWAIPVVAVAAPAPAFAASPVPCPTFTTVGWTESVSGSVNTAPRGFTGAGTAYKMNTDAASSAGATITVTSPAIAVTAGVTYNLAVKIQTQYGVNLDGNGPAGTRNTNFTASFVHTLDGTSATIGPYSTQTSGGGTVVTPVNGSLSTGITPILTYTATTTGTAQIRYVFTMTGTTRGNDDDYLVTASYTTCTR